MNKKFIVALITLATVTNYALAPAASVLATEKGNIQKIHKAHAVRSNNSISNSEINLTLEDNGDIYLETKDGVRLLFGGTNMEAIKIDNEIYSVYHSDFKHTKLNDSTIVSTAIINGIEVKRTLSIVKGATTDSFNTIKFSYNLKNTTDKSTNISYKLMLDTLINENDYAPFSIPGHGQFDTGKNLYGSQVPNYWFAYDDLENPTVVTKGTLSGTKPSRITFGSWIDIIDSYMDWDLKATEGEPNNDSCVMMDWNNNTINPGKSFSFSTAYGLDNLNVEVDPELTLSLLGNETIELIENENCLFDPYTASAILKNSGDVDLTDLKVEVLIPDQFKNILSLENPNLSVQTLDSLKQAEEKLLNYNFNISPVENKTEVYYEIKVTAQNLEAKTIRQNIVLNTRDYQLTGSLENGLNHTINPNSSNKYDVYNLKATIENSSKLDGLDFSAVKAKLEIPEEFKGILSLDETSNDTIEIGDLLKNDKANASWNLLISDSFEDRQAYVNVIVTTEQGKELTLKQNLNITKLTKPVEPSTPEGPNTPQDKPQDKPQDIPQDKPQEKPNKKPAKLPATALPTTAPVSIGALMTVLGALVIKKRK